MLDAVAENLEKTKNLTEALIISDRRRFRPVLMTSLATILGMAPLALALGAGSELTPSAACDCRDRRFGVFPRAFAGRYADRLRSSAKPEARRRIEIIYKNFIVREKFMSWQFKNFALESFSLIFVNRIFSCCGRRKPL